MSNRPQLQPAAKYSGHSHRQQFENAWNRRYRTMREPPAVDVPAASKRSTVSYCGQRHRRTQAEPDETASDDEAERILKLAKAASAVHADADSAIS